MCLVFISKSKTCFRFQISLCFYLSYLLLQVRLEDSGKYICWANNSAGEESVRVTLEVTAPLSAHVQPHVQVVDVGKQAAFQCIIGGHPVSRVHWLHNGKPIAKDGRVDLSTDPAHKLQVSVSLNFVSLTTTTFKANVVLFKF